MSNPTAPAAVVNPNVKTYTADDVRRLKDLIREGCQVLQEIEDLRTSLNDTIKAIAEEVDVKPGQLKKAVAIAHKRSLDEERAKFEEIEDILETVGVV